MENIRDLIAAGRLEEALDALARSNQDAILLKARYANGKKQYNMGLVDFGEWQRVQNQVAYAALEMANSGSTNLPPTGGTTSANTSGPSAPPAPNSVRNVKLFLASSSELREDRDDFELYFRQLNDHLPEEKGIYLRIVRWENFLDAMSATRLQDEYNKEITNCDLFVSLFFTKTGKYTEEEFDVALSQFKQTGKPLIFTFFKKGSVDIDAIGDNIQTLQKFKQKLSDLGHFYTSYNDIEHLKRQFRDQLDKMLREGKI